MKIELPDETVRDVQAMFAKQGLQGDVAQYIDRTVQRALMFETVREVKRQNAAVDSDDLDRLIDEAVDSVRTDRRRTASGADGA